MKDEYVKDLLSIIIVTYNQQKYIYETIDSILKQNYNSIEIIIADDATPHLDLESIKDYIIKNKNRNILNVIYLVNSKNIGTVKNINNALKVANGEYIKLIGGDDTFTDAEVFKLQVDYLKKDSSLFAIVGKANQCDEFLNVIYDKRVDKSNSALPNVLTLGYEDALKYIYNNDIFPIAIQATCFRRNFYLQTGLCDEDYVLIDDVPIILRLLKNNTRLGFLDYYCVNHRGKVGISASRNFFDVKRVQYYKDNLTYFNKEVRYSSNIYSFLYRFEMTRIHEYIYKMTMVRKEKKGFLMYAYNTIIYIDAIIYYCLTKPRKILNRILYK